MLSVDEALELVLRHARPLPPVRVPVDQSLFRALAEDVVADADSPPFAKSIWDGFAVRSADVLAGRRDFKVLERVTAGDVPRHTVSEGTATEVMTGAPIPQGADSIVVVERSSSLAAGGGMVCLVDPDFIAGQGVLHQGAAMRKGDVALRRGSLVRPVEIGLLAEVGRQEVLVREVSRVALVATGNELVPTATVPGPGRIRNSNGPMLRACVECLGGDVLDLGIARDDESDLRARFEEGLAGADLLLISGGVSAGVLDLVPRVLAACGVEKVFHKVNLKPGKPLWFGVWEGTSRRSLVFGLPGNPVSTLVCFELFVRPAMAVLGGLTSFGAEEFAARLDARHEHKGNRLTYFPAVLFASPECPRVTPLAWQGSADLHTLARANALIRFPVEPRVYERGETVRVRPLWARDRG